MNSIYQYVNKTNGHMYIGLAKDPDRRRRDHENASFNPNHKEYNYPIHKAIRKYGTNNFEFNILEDNLKNIQEMKQREIYWIDYFNTYKDRQHYNQTPGGDLPGKNTIHKGEEHGRAKLSEEDVRLCRQYYKDGLRARQVWESSYQDKIPWPGFQRMWHGKTWKHVMPEVFEINPHPKKKYTKKDCEYLIQKFKESGLSLFAFSKSEECYVGYGTIYKMVHKPEFYK